jgi:polysaccharide pyruvyl transferase WcaK-like protein
MTCNKKIRFAILDQFSGRSSGCHAAVDIMIKEIKEIYPNATFDLYTVLFPDIKRFFPTHRKYLKKVSMNPWWGSVNFLGFPALVNVPKSDVIIFRGGHLFDKKLYNPLYSYLLNFFFVIPYAKSFKKPVVTYSIGVGPFNTKIGKMMFKKVLENIDLITLRESGSKKIINDLGEKVDAVFADPAYNLKASNNITSLMKQLHLSSDKQYIGLNITSLIDMMVHKKGDIRISKDLFTNAIINLMGKLYRQNNIETILFPTDTEYEIFTKIADTAHTPVTYVDREKYSPYDIAALMSICKCFVGMRMHSLIFALSQYVPTIGIVYNDKIRYILEDSNMRDKVFDIHDVVEKPDMLYEKIVSIINNYKTEHEFTKANIIPMQEKAKQMPARLKMFLDE